MNAGCAKPRRLRQMGARSVLVKGGHLAAPPNDILLDGEECTSSHPRASIRRTRTDRLRLFGGQSRRAGLREQPSNAVARGQDVYLGSYPFQSRVRRVFGPRESSCRGATPAMRGTNLFSRPYIPTSM